MKRTIQIVISLICISSVPMNATWEGFKELTNRGKGLIGFVAAVDSVALISGYMAYKCNKKKNEMKQKEDAAKRGNPVIGDDPRKTYYGSRDWDALASICKGVSIITGIYGGMLTLVGLNDGYECLTDSKNWFAPVQ